MTAAADMPALDACTVQCPYCGETLELTVDASAGAQRYVEDCAVCCRPIEVRVEADVDGLRLVVRHENEA
jgi:hypothetical protein